MVGPSGVADPDRFRTAAILISACELSCSDAKAHPCHSLFCWVWNAAATADINLWSLWAGFPIRPGRSDHLQASSKSRHRPSRMRES